MAQPVSENQNFVANFKMTKIDTVRRDREGVVMEIEKALSWAMEKKLTIRLEEIKQILNQFKK